jgi:5-dehydro-2-deoxygluconokinase
LNAPIVVECDAPIKIIVCSILATVSAIVAGTDTVLDLIAVGRSSVDLYGEQIGGKLEDMGSFAKYIGGSPTNTAVAAARLGLKAS